MSKNPLKINLIRTKLLTIIDSEIRIKKAQEELPSLNKSPLDFQNNIKIEMKDYSHSLQKIMRGFDTFLKGNTIIQFKRKEKNKISNSTKQNKCIKNINSEYPFRYLKNLCSMVKIQVKLRSKTDFKNILIIDSEKLIKKNKNTKKIDFEKFIMNL